jgi:hypothetical protein
MRPGCKAFLGVFFAMALICTSALAMADEITQTIASRVIESFDDPNSGNSWLVQASKYTTKGFPQAELVRTWPEALYGKNRENVPHFAYGIHSKFDRKSYNFIEIIPVGKDANGKVVSKPIPIPGRAKNIDMWVWGANYNYWLDAHIRDFQGIDHVIRMGSLNYSGWRNLSAAIPGAIPQARRYIPRYAGLELTKLVIWTSPEEKVDDYYFFIDEISVLTDLFETKFDGEDLAEPSSLESLWKQGTK